ncbi:hypothetical protein SCAR479_02749 [Seiridium cardinale]|uniref:Uncharacterized protein n=1 Tax=Seiridium cardinale TaxID=138064 RepID=A0ABR2Y3K8_9PEZI
MGRELTSSFVMTKDNVAGGSAAPFAAGPVAEEDCPGRDMGESVNRSKRGQASTGHSPTTMGWVPVEGGPARVLLPLVNEPAQDWIAGTAGWLGGSRH